MVKLRNFTIFYKENPHNTITHKCYLIRTKHRTRQVFFLYRYLKENKYISRKFKFKLTFKENTINATTAFKLF